MEWNKPDSLECALDVLLAQSYSPGLLVELKEDWFIDMMNPELSSLGGGGHMQF